jgi:hypothetical protein
MLHACVERFDVMGRRGNILGWDEEVNKALVNMDSVLSYRAPCSPTFMLVSLEADSFLYNLVLLLP